MDENEKLKCDDFFRYISDLALRLEKREVELNSSIEVSKRKSLLVPHYLKIEKEYIDLLKDLLFRFGIDDLISETKEQFKKYLDTYRN